MQGIPRTPSRTALGLAFLCALATGCGSDEIQGVPVKGKVVKNGQPLQLKNDALVIFFVTTHGGRPIRSSAIYKVADSTFVCDGPIGRGIPEGNYRIEMHPVSADFPPNIDRVFQGEFLGAKSPLTIQLSKANSQDIVVDVGTKTVTAP